VSISQQETENFWLQTTTTCDVTTLELRMAYTFFRTAKMN
jgi:hypothetical protein